MPLRLHGANAEQYNAVKRRSGTNESQQLGERARIGSLLSTH